ncbi:hypothetical protein HPB51_025805 [Rhipicephalus microplus]|uniref:Uncharacterized protein n=1 Tax=Rhipicephalus microplus TaxID=6941 RepID=A0A9J6DDS0_RHIMP|nr:hypothetical protein HPB51_025805 [Rhipicephalus microplus]
MLEASSACPLGDLNKVVKLEEWAAVAAAPPGAYRYPHHHLHPPTPQPGPAPSGRQVGRYATCAGVPGEPTLKGSPGPVDSSLLASFRDRYLGASAPPFGGMGSFLAPPPPPHFLGSAAESAASKCTSEVARRPAGRGSASASPASPAGGSLAPPPVNRPALPPGATSATGNDKRSFVANEAPSGNTATRVLRTPAAAGSAFKREREQPPSLLASSRGEENSQSLLI